MVMEKMTKWSRVKECLVRRHKSCFYFRELEGLEVVGKSTTAKFNKVLSDAIILFIVYL
jgi:hypothetical protein